FRTTASVHVWHKTNEKYNHDCIAGTVSKKKTKMNMQFHHLNQMFLHQNGLFQQDNALVHKAKVVQAELIKANVEILSWPSRSPGLNPMKNV
ncbi:3347_t:CDS:2, partial [Acaulospora morrowiae]